MQKSEFADHLVLKCQFQSVLFADRLKITRNSLETAGNGDLMTWEKFFFPSRPPFKARQTKLGPGETPSDIQMNKIIIIIQMKERDILPEKRR